MADNAIENIGYVYLQDSGELTETDVAAWELPEFQIHEFKPKATKYCFLVVIWNEGDRIKNQLKRMKQNCDLADIIIADGDSDDGSTEHEFLKENGVRALLVTKERGLCTATRMAAAYALMQGYEGIVTVDGNGKDGVEALPDFISALEDGYDLVQGSRFMKGGVHRNTPLSRYLGIRRIVSPLLSLSSGFFFSDPPNAFRAMSRNFLLDKRVLPFRKEFVRFNLQLYFVYRAAKLDFRVKEIPVKRIYPRFGPIPTKISFIGTLVFLKDMFQVALGLYNPKIDLDL